MECSCKEISSIGISLGVFIIVCEIFAMTSNDKFSPWNFCSILLNILWIYGMYARNVTLVLPLVIAEGFYLCLLCTYCFPLWILQEIQQSSNSENGAYPQVFILPIVMKVTLILTMFFMWILKYSLYTAIKQNDFVIENTV